jgi:prophage regulatory protein
MPPIFAPRDKAAQALGVSERTLEALVAAGEAPPPRKISKGRVGWLWRELVEFAESRPVSDLRPGPGRTAAAADQPTD